MDKQLTEPESLKVAQWVIGVIESCNNAQQMELCENLVEFYQLRFKENHMDNIKQAFNAHALKTDYFKYKDEKQKKSTTFISEKQPIS